MVVRVNSESEWNAVGIKNVILFFQSFVLNKTLR